MWFLWHNVTVKHDNITISQKTLRNIVQTVQTTLRTQTQGDKDIKQKKQFRSSGFSKRFEFLGGVVSRFELPVRDAMTRETSKRKLVGLDVSHVGTYRQWDTLNFKFSQHIRMFKSSQASVEHEQTTYFKDFLNTPFFFEQWKTLRNMTVFYNFGPVALVPLPFTCRMIKDEFPLETNVKMKFRFATGFAFLHFSHSFILSELSHSKFCLFFSVFRPASSHGPCARCQDASQKDVTIKVEKPGEQHEVGATWGVTTSTMQTIWREIYICIYKYIYIYIYVCMYFYVHGSVLGTESFPPHIGMVPPLPTGCGGTYRGVGGARKCNAHT